MREGQRAARFEGVVRDVVEPVRRFLHRRADPDTAEDVLSETLLVCWRRLDDIPAEPLPWTYVVARNCLANATRSDRRQLRLVGRIRAVDPPVEVAPAPEPADDAISTALAALPPDDAEVLRLWAWEELAPRDIAVVLGITPNAASIRLHRAKKKLGDVLGKTTGGAGHEQDTERNRG